VTINPSPSTTHNSVASGTEEAETSDTGGQSARQGSGAKTSKKAKAKKNKNKKKKSGAGASSSPSSYDISGGAAASTSAPQVLYDEDKKEEEKYEVLDGEAYDDDDNEEEDNHAAHLLANGRGRQSLGGTTSSGAGAMDEASRAQITEYTSNRVAAADPVQLTIEEVCLRTGYNAAAVGSCITALFDMGLVRYVLYCSMLLLRHNLTPPLPCAPPHALCATLNLSTSV
jgi:hypothetical protein